MNNKRLITTERIFKYGLISFGRNIWLAIAAIAMMTITLTILLFGIVANTTFRHTIDNLTSHIDVSVYLKDGVTDAQREKLVKQLDDLPNVKAVDYISKEQVLKRYQEQNADNPLLLSAISEAGNPLSAELHIKPTDPNNLQTIKDFLDKPNVQAMQSDPTSYSGDRKAAIDKITSATHFFEEAGIVGIIIFTVISMLIIFNTIRMAIFNRRDELVIMRLLGASTWFIRGPFVVETMFYGAAAALISLGICAALFAIASQTLNASTFGLLDISFSSQYFKDNIWSILTIQLLVGIIIGAASSAIATRRYLKLSR